MPCTGARLFCQQDDTGPHQSEQTVFHLRHNKSGTAQTNARSGYSSCLPRVLQWGQIPIAWQPCNSLAQLNILHDKTAVVMRCFHGLSVSQVFTLTISNIKISPQ